MDDAELAEFFKANTGQERQRLIQNEKNFREELRSVINKYSRENGSSTPDFILAEYLAKCLQAFDAAMSERAAYYGDDGK